MKKQSIFVHIPKCAGCSLWEALCKSEHCEHSEPRGPNSKLSLQSKFGSSTLEYFGHGEGRMLKPFPCHDSYKNYFSFSFVRNPWDRLVSTFFFLKSGGHHKNDMSAYSKYMKTHSESFKEFIIEKFNNEAINQVIHLKPQHHWICQNDQVCVDFLGKTESLQNNVNELCSALNIESIELRHLNQSTHKHYAEYYDNETREIVAEKYARDIEYFGYKFGE